MRASAHVEPEAQEATKSVKAVARTAASAVSPFAAPIALSLALDERLALWQQRGQLGFFLPLGDWAGVLAAVCAATAPGDLLCPSARESRLAVFRGLPLADYLLQHLGLDASGSDPAQSLAGHALPGTIADAARRVTTPGGSPAAHLPHAVGAAMAARYLKRDEAVVALAGAVATDADDCHVALNFAAVFRAPVVFLFRGDSGRLPGEIAARALGYAVHAEEVNGSDLPAVQRRLESMLAAARAGKGPSVLEVTPPAPLEVEAAMLWQARTQCDAAFALAQRGRRPGLDSLTHGVLAQPTWPLDEELRIVRGEPLVPPEEI